MRIVLKIILLSIIMTLPCHARDMRVKEVKNKEAVIEDLKSGKKVRVKQGEKIWDDWKVIEVTDSIVTIEKEIGPHKRIRGQMPVALSRQENLTKMSK